MAPSFAGVEGSAVKVQVPHKISIRPILITLHHVIFPELIMSDVM